MLLVSVMEPARPGTGYLPYLAEFCLLCFLKIMHQLKAPPLL